MTLKPSLPDSYVCRVERDEEGRQLCVLAGGRGLVTGVFTPQCVGLAVASCCHLLWRTNPSGMQQLAVGTDSYPCQRDTALRLQLFQLLARVGGISALWIDLEHALELLFG